ncbi:DUF499 domain-containing protein [Candidatus Epulonipiscium viviparus]|uniref:DUF499 domain-containing protein n=1 Tax=Candidatus Epulonipiscium viviparus TaxID=420336 RepID=UPI0027381385|nr:DUF499 domain-containing protein [Candidatus Epulopiscium viviparus]
MKSVKSLLVPRSSVFKNTTREDVLNLTDFAEGKIDATAFFEENFQTAGMSALFEAAFSRFRGESETGVIKLTQAMGGGKTHSMLALALLAENAELRRGVIAVDDVGEIKVVTFSGRENAPRGLWGHLAQQLGKMETFGKYYAPLQAPGESDWIKLLAGERILILLDELPPYLENAKAIAIGNSDLAKVTVTALANLFSALGKEQLANVCLVFSDLRAAYESGSQLLRSSFRELEAETNRVAKEVTPVALNSDEIYSILHTKLFENTAGEEEIKDIATAYKKAVAKSVKLGLTNYNPDAVFAGVKDSYPFHPSIKPLYARFKENPNFQQTRGLIRFMRLVVRQFYESGAAEKRYLINVFDFNLNEQKILSQIYEINPSLDAPINHDIAQNGKAIAEIVDSQCEGDAAQEVAKLLLVSSLSATHNGLLGLSKSEIVGYLSSPEANIERIKDALGQLNQKCWYLKTDNVGRVYFQNTKNMVAQLNELAQGYSDEDARGKLRKMLREIFKPVVGKYYDRVYVFPEISDIKLDENKVALVIYEPYKRLHPMLEKFYEQVQRKNRVLFLSGQRNMLEKLHENAKMVLAIESIYGNLKEEGNTQLKEAEIMKDRQMQNLISTIRELFVTLYFPTKNGIDSKDFRLEFTKMKYNGEEQIAKCLLDARKYEEVEEQGLEILRKKCEQRIFIAKTMTLKQLKERAATEPSWQWYPAGQLEKLLKACIAKDAWREKDGYIIKGPFVDPTEVKVEQVNYDEKSNKFRLKVMGIGGEVYYAKSGALAETKLLEEELETSECRLNFRCVDPTGKRVEGEMVKFVGKVPIAGEQYEDEGAQIFRIVAHPEYAVKYTIDGSNPKENGELYAEPIEVAKGCREILVAVFLDKTLVEERRFEVIEVVDGVRAVNKKERLIYMRQKQWRNTATTYKDFEELERFAKIRGATIAISDKTMSVNLSMKETDEPAKILQLINDIRETVFKERDVEIISAYQALEFKTGKLFLDWAKKNKLEVEDLRKDGEIIQQ